MAVRYADFLNRDKVDLGNAITQAVNIKLAQSANALKRRQLKFDMRTQDWREKSFAQQEQRLERQGERQNALDERRMDYLEETQEQTYDINRQKQALEVAKFMRKSKEAHTKASAMQESLRILNKGGSIQEAQMAYTQATGDLAGAENFKIFKSDDGETIEIRTPKGLSFEGQPGNVGGLLEIMKKFAEINGAMPQDLIMKAAADMKVSVKWPEPEEEKDIMTSDYKNYLLEQKDPGYAKARALEKGGGPVDLPPTTETAQEGQVASPFLSMDEVKKGAGAISFGKQLWNNTIGQFKTGKESFPEVSAAKNKIQMFNQAVKAAVVNNRRFPVQEQLTVQKFLPSESAWKDPDEAAMNFARLHTYLRQRWTAKAEAINSGRALGKEAEDYRAQINNIREVLSLMENPSKKAQPEAKRTQERITATNHDTGERLESFDGGDTWQPIK